MFERKTQEYVKFPINQPEKLNLDPFKFWTGIRLKFVRFVAV